MVGSNLLINIINTNMMANFLVFLCLFVAIGENILNNIHMRDLDLAP